MSNITPPDKPTSLLHQRSPSITVVAGARPNFMKVAPVVAALEKAAQIRFIHTGQHYDHRLSGALIEDLGLPAPNANFGVGSGSPASQTSATMVAFERELLTYPADAVVVAGDVNSTLACALVAAQQRVPVAHIESGLRSGDWAMPEELNRVLTDRLSTWLFTTSAAAGANLAHEGIRGEQVYFVGNTMIDSLYKFLPSARRLVPGLLHDFELDSGFGLVTLHRGSNVDDPSVLSGMLRELGRLSGHLRLLFPLHPRTANALKRHGIAIPSNIRACDALTYLEFIGLMERASLVLTDSGGVQEETSALGVPCLTLRTTTERPETCELGTNRLIGTNPSEILPAAFEAIGKLRKPTQIPLWDGRAAPRIGSVLMSSLQQLGQL